MWDGIGKQGAGRFVGTAVLDGKLYAVGRASEADEAPSISVDRYDLASKAWEAVAPMATARDELTVAVLDGKLFRLNKLFLSHPVSFPFLFSLQHPLFSLYFPGETIKFSGL